MAIALIKAIAFMLEIDFIAKDNSFMLAGNFIIKVIDH